MALRKKLYYNVAFVSGAANSQALVTWRRITANPTRVNDGIVAAAAAFTNGGLGGADGDIYGNVLAPVEFNGLRAGASTDQQRKSRQAISAWFQASSITMDGAFTSQAFVLVDFIAPVATLNAAAGPSNVAAAAAITDPVLNLRPWVRLRRRAASDTLRGRLYVQRQHAIEA